MKWILLIFVLFQFSCIEIKTLNQVSESIAESKGKEVLISILKAYPKGSIVLNDSLSFSIKEAWIENMWHYENGGLQMIKDTIYRQVIIRLHNDVIEKVFSNFDIKTPYGLHLGLYTNRFILDYKQHEWQDGKIKLKIYSKANLEEVASFYLQKE